uniref:UDPsugar transporter putative n=1 Tax=Albugo laibachii Nc14 TaxID=890382 RepID=F0WDF0_9STRA|nr:UDPsugar transporter putative [Albugo laibachii Nc14]|eukprot:CCA19222.1 UDPsugar transporter putative [Albugo laibachii Nc14]
MNVHEIVAISATILSLCLGNVCVKASKRGGKITYSMGTTLLMVQLVSFSICLIAMIVAKLIHKPIVSWKFSRTTAYYAVPVAFAIADYHIILFLSKRINPALLSIVWNSEIAVTALLCRCFLKRSITRIGRISIILLVLGSVTSQSNYKLRTDTNNKEWTAVFLIIGIFVSAIANIFIEWAYKREIAVSFLIQTLQITFLGVCFHGVNAFLELESGLFNGFNGWTWGAVAMHSIANIGINYLMKYLDNIVCLYVHAVATMLTVVVSVPMFHADISLQFLCGSGITIISIYLHNYANPMEGYLIPSSENRVESDEAVDLNILSPKEGLDCVPDRIHKRERLIDFLSETSGRFSRKRGTYQIITKTAYNESEQA